VLTAECCFSQQPFSPFPESIFKEGKTMPIDPVCKMEISVAGAAASHDYHSETLYFCSTDCLRKFERDPARYMDEMGDEERVAS